MKPFATLLLIVPLSVLTGCDTGPGTDTTPAAAEPERSAVSAKDDFVPIGSCEGACGDKTLTAGGNCWCEELCTHYGDCCTDMATLCRAPEGCSTNKDCGEGAYCGGGICRPRVPEGGPCDFNSWCLEGLECVRGACTPPKCYRTGCGNELCRHHPSGDSTCIYQAIHACYDLQGASCEFQPDGSCGWTLAGEAADCAAKLEPAVD